MVGVHSGTVEVYGGTAIWLQCDVACVPYIACVEQGVGRKRNKRGRRG